MAKSGVSISRHNLQRMLEILAVPRTVLEFARLYWGAAKAKYSDQKLYKAGRPVLYQLTSQGFARKIGNGGPSFDAYLAIPSAYERAYPGSHLGSRPDGNPGSDPGAGLEGDPDGDLDSGLGDDDEYVHDLDRVVWYSDDPAARDVPGVEHDDAFASVCLITRRGRRFYVDDGFCKVMLAEIAGVTPDSSGRGTVLMPCDWDCSVIHPDDELAISPMQARRILFLRAWRLGKVRQRARTTNAAAGL